MKKTLLAIALLGAAIGSQNQIIASDENGKNLAFAGGMIAAAGGASWIVGKYGMANTVGVSLATGVGYGAYWMASNLFTCFNCITPGYTVMIPSFIGIITAAVLYAKRADIFSKRPSRQIEDYGRLMTFGGLGLAAAGSLGYFGLKLVSPIQPIDTTGVPGANASVPKNLGEMVRTV